MLSLKPPFFNNCKNIILFSSPDQEYEPNICTYCIWLHMGQLSSSAKSSGTMWLDVRIILYPVIVLLIVLLPLSGSISGGGNMSSVSLSASLPRIQGSRLLLVIGLLGAPNRS